jgi:hypothetical protein
MHDILIVLLHSIVTIVRVLKPGGLRAAVAESALTRHQLLILNRSRKRAPNLRVSDRLIAGLCTLLMHPARMLRCGIVLKPSTLLHFHHVRTKLTKHRQTNSVPGRTMVVCCGLPYICLDDEGRSLFLELLRHRGVDPFRYAFDLLWLDGGDLRGLMCMG